MTMPPAWRAVMRNGCEDLARTQHKGQLFSARLSSPQKSFRIVEAYSKPLLLPEAEHIRTQLRWLTASINGSLFCRSIMFRNHMDHPRSPNIQSNYFQTFLQRMPSLWKEATEDRKCFHGLHPNRKPWYLQKPVAKANDPGPVGASWPGANCYIPFCICKMGRTPCCWT